MWQCGAALASLPTWHQGCANAVVSLSLAVRFSGSFEQCCGKKSRTKVKDAVRSEGQQRLVRSRVKMDPYIPLYELGRGKAWQMHA